MKHLKGESMQRITTFLWFDDQAEEAAKFYVSLFKKSKVTGVFGSNGKDKALTVSFRLEGQDFMALNGGPHFKFTPAISLFVDCKTQKEVDRLWKKLGEGGKDSQCGWLQDKYGFITLPEDAYFISKAVVKLEWWHLLLVNGGTFLICFLVLMIPTLVVRKMQPVRAIQFR